MVERRNPNEALDEAKEALRITNPASPMVELMNAMGQVAIAEQLGRIADAMEAANARDPKQVWDREAQRALDQVKGEATSTLPRNSGPLDLSDSRD